MNRRSLIKAATAALLLFSTTFVTTDFQKSDDETELGKHMEAINKILKPMRVTLREASQNQKNLAATLKLQEHALAAKKLNPAMMTTIPEAKKAAFLADYREGMHEFIALMFDIELALLKNDNAAAEAAYKKLKKTKSSSHKVFKPKKKKKD